MLESIMLLVTLGVTVGLSLFSFLWVNRAIILMMAPAYPLILKLTPIVEYSNNHRDWLVWVWLGLISVLFICQVYFLMGKKKKKSNLRIWVLFVLIGLVATVAYPLFSKDVFNYLFAGKIITEYHQNPYLVKPNAYLGKDLWVDFMSNVDNDYRYLGVVDWKYAYGPVSVLYSLVSTVIANANRFILAMLVNKLLNWLVFIVGGFMLYKINKNDQKVWAYWFLSPLLLTELLMNAHNDLPMIVLEIAAVFVWQRKKLVSWLMFVMSVLTKFVSGPLVIQFFLKGKARDIFFKIFGFGVLLYCALIPKYPWYYTWAYMALPLANLKKSTWVGLVILEYLVLITYYSGFIWLNRWTNLPFLPVWSNVVLRSGITLVLMLNETGLLGKLVPKRLEVSVR